MRVLTTGLENNKWLRHGFFTRLGGLSTGIYTSLNCALATQDNPEHVYNNRTKVADMIGVKPDNLLTLKQVHGIDVVEVKKPWDADKAPEADSMVTTKKGIALGILTADCAPVLLAYKKKKIIGAAHAGWRSAVGGVLEATIEKMEALGAQREDLEVAIGPCIGPNSYEVKKDFTEAFLAQDTANERFFKPATRDARLLFNLPGYVESRLRAAGVKQIYDMGQDTLTNETAFFSCRRAFLKSEKDFGRQISVIAIK